MTRYSWINPRMRRGRRDDTPPYASVHERHLERILDQLRGGKNVALLVVAISSDPEVDPITSIRAIGDEALTRLLPAVEGLVEITIELGAQGLTEISITEQEREP